MTKTQRDDVAVVTRRSPSFQQINGTRVFSRRFRQRDGYRRRCLAAVSRGFDRPQTVCFMFLGGFHLMEFVRAIRAYTERRKFL